MKGREQGRNEQKKEERRKENTNIFENFYVPCFAHSE